MLTQYCIRILWNIYRVKCRHVAKGNKAIPLSLLHRLRAPRSILAGAMPICRFSVFCQLPFFSLNFQRSFVFAYIRCFLFKTKDMYKGIMGSFFLLPQSLRCKCQVQVGCYVSNWYFNALSATPKIDSSFSITL